MKNLWAPWRMEYILSEKKPGCIFCEKPAETSDRKNLILHRGEKCYIIMNLYPYNNGHLMVVPYRHEETLGALDDDSIAQMMILTRKITAVLDALMKPQGYNVGLNVGRVAGAGIHEHIHLHVVPRWLGDSNFMPVVSDSKVINEHILETYDKIRRAIVEKL
ncbi:MAG: HIT domain-containing protein [bacterium]